MNLEMLRRSRKPLRPGDVFAMLPPDRLYLFGRVIAVSLPRERAPIETANLIYIYQHRSVEKRPARKELRPENLLLPPIYTNRLGWSKGYFETIDHWPLEPGDLLAQHCFWDALRACYVDENERVLPAPVEPAGDWGLASYRTIDDEVSEALGLERAPN